MLSCTTAKTMSSNVASSSTGATYNLMKGIDGDTFLDFTTADFEKCRIPSGPAKKIEQPFAAMNPNDLAFVFIDNTNYPQAQEIIEVGGRYSTLIIRPTIFSKIFYDSVMYLTDWAFRTC
ncbi:unnamed protein product [Rhizophagus irregularis]|nr:unnamed protein product [Rhizophagus irregularis]